ncbi:MAG: YggS family pyridoxal phosphate-dependent enzyme [Oscillatoriophycideae cyanobacterium NC_groundwater_1537_Pr4_S-0.65um_50_18]|nr:YggS family pyridoxal phosphate-dependent enzyme [Oscillatoriophycideae cyanobacterium NC_groundwater_1537_Pr4_S-0.65um_50_18]
MNSSQLSQIVDRLGQIRQTLPPNVKLIAVTKQVPAEVMRLAYEAGIRDFGENRIQEAESKQEQLKDLDVTWHLIGHLQSNKAAKALEHFHWIHSVDSLKLAQRLHQILDQRAESSPHQPIQKPKICLQVKLLPDPNKFGWSAPELLSDLPLLDQCTNLNIVGLMSIPPLGLEPDATLSVFTQTRDLAEKIRQQHCAHIQMQELSMGMSGDYPLAVQAGATLIRLGRTLFGDRA